MEVEPMEPSLAEHTSDQRLIKGARARSTIARHAADVASAEGLTGLSIGRLAADLGLSKSGVAGLFGTKEKLQLAAIAEARQVFIDTVITPSFREPGGARRLRALLENWLTYIIEPVFSGGCFRVAAIADFKSRPGPVRDALAGDRADWLELLAKQVRRAKEQGYFADRDPAGVAFELDAVLVGVNIALQLGDRSAVAIAKEMIDRLVPV
jgi:AcrR family transcriptional regulator